MEQFFEHVWQLVHLSLSAMSCSEGQLPALRIFLPIIMKGAIQQPEWQNALLPAASETPAMMPKKTKNVMADVMSEIEIP